MIERSHPGDRVRPTATARRASRGHEAGFEPPLDSAGSLAPEIDRRGVNLRWLLASVLTAFTGAGLLGTAIYVSVQGETSFAELPERVATAPVRDVDERGDKTARKADKLVRTDMTVAAKHSFRAPISTRVGDREAIRVRSFTRIATALSQTSGVYATEIPPFNPMRLFSGPDEDRIVEATPEVGDADVSLVKRDLASLTVEPSSPSLSDDEVAAQLEEERRFIAQAGRRPSLPMPAQLMLSRTLRQPSTLPEMAAYARVVDEPFNSIEVRVVPENVTTHAKSDERASDILVEEHGAALKRNEPIDAVLKSFGATPDQIRGLVDALGGRAKVSQLGEGQQMRILVAPGPRPGDRRQIMRVILFGENGVESIAAANDRGVYVSVTPLTTGAKTQVASTGADEEDEDEESGSGARLYESLYETALKHDLPKQTVQDLIRIFGYDVDFQRRVSSGDTFEIFYTADDETSDRPEVLYASLTVGGEARRVYRFHSPEDNSIDFFDDQGRSLKKFLLRKPIAEGILRSGFGSRRHPILGYAKMHTGVDWANRIGTPILASGNGVVTKAGWEGGYGRHVALQHANGYETTYSHMSRFAPGIKEGARVRQGQVIGYVGTTGLSTGPHLHYEVVVNGHFVDPLKIRVPRGRELDGRALVEFRRQRDQVNGLMEKAGASTRVAQTSER